MAIVAILGEIIDPWVAPPTSFYLDALYAWLAAPTPTAFDIDALYAWELPNLISDFDIDTLYAWLPRFSEYSPLLMVIDEAERTMSIADQPRILVVDEVARSMEVTE